MATDQSHTAQGGRHFTISYAGFNRPWAAWIAHQLDRLGHQTTQLRWDPGATLPLTEALGDLLLAEGRVLLVLDDWYFKLGPRTVEEWTSAFRQAVHPHVDRFAAVSVATQALPTSVAAIRPVDLRDLDETEARRRLLQRLDLPLTEPTRGPFAQNAPKFPLDPPVVHSVPRRTQSFTGRDPILEDLHERLSQGGPQGARMLLQGPGGVGKSAIAAEYAHRFGSHYDVVYWIDARSRAIARENLAELAPLLDLNVGRDIGARIRAVHESLRLGRPHPRWLLVFDGADEPKNVVDLLPDGPGHVLVTALGRVWLGQAAMSEMTIGPFLREESVAYARRRAPRLTPQEADALAAAVDDLPLMVAQTASWLNTNDMPVAEYVAQIQGGQLDNLSFGVDKDYPRGFPTVWAITLNTLRDQHPSAAELLKLLAQFSPDRIPVALLQQARPGDLPDPIARLTSNSIDWHTALARIADSTVVRLDYLTGASVEARVGTARMHRLYHTFLRNELPDEERRSMSAIACQVLVGADPRRPSESRDWPIYAELIPQLEPAGALRDTTPSVRELILNCIEYLKLRGEFTTGRELCEQARGPWIEALGPTDHDVIVLEMQHANLLRRSGRYREAERLCRELLDRVADRPEDDPDLLYVRNGLGGTLLALARMDESLALYQDLWQLHRDGLGPEAPGTLRARSNYGLALALSGRYDEALTVHGDLLAARERLLRREHLHTLATGRRYAWLLRLVGRYPEAQSRQELNARLYRQVLGENSPETLLAEHNLAQCQRRSGDLAGASELMRSVVQRSVQAHGAEHPETLMVQADWSTFLRQRGELEEAQKLADFVAARYRDMVGEAHPYAMGTLGNTGLLLWALGDWDTAVQIGESAWRGMSAAVGPDHPWTLGCALNLAGARQFAGDELGALELSRDTLQRARQTLGPSHPLVFSCQAALAADLRVLRHTEEAVKLEREVLEQLATVLGSNHPHTVAVRRRDRPYWDFEPQPI